MLMIETFDSDVEATTRVLKTILSYMLHADKQLHMDFAKKYAPDIKLKNPKNKLSIVVFDIDDTVLHDVKDNKIIANKQIVKFLKRLHELGAEIHFITARLNQPDIVEQTIIELKQLDLGNVYVSLSLAPECHRKSMAHVSKWKMMTRKKIASQNSIPITLTVGDQWGDMVVLENDEKIEILDKEHGNNKFHFVRPNDKVSLWGLKLPVYT